MTRAGADQPHAEPDIVLLVLQKVIEMAPGFSAALAKQIEQEVKEKHGGQRVFVPKGARRMSDTERLAVYQDGLTNMETQEISSKHNVSRSTIYRIMKTGGGRFG